MRARLQLVAVGVCALLAGCGTPGAPQPPSLQLPAPVQDLAATRVGDKVTLTWTPPQRTTDGVIIRRAGPTLVCRGLNSSVMLQCPKVGEVSPAPPHAAKAEKAEFTDSLAPEVLSPNPAAFATYAIEVKNDRGRSAGLSNQVQVPLAPTLAPPQQISAEVTAQGPVISWVVPPEEANRVLLPEAQKARAPVSYDFRLYRRDLSQPNAPAVGIPVEGAYVSPRLQQPNLNVLDSTTEWEKTYVYHVTVATTVKTAGKAIEIEGAPSAEVTVVTHDTFPPATPSGLQAVASGAGQPPFIDLTWAPNTDSDLAGYDVFRHEEGQPPVKINDKPVAAPAYRDGNVQRGHKYFYSVSAVDLRGNESTKSAETSETVP